jgi:outer membrane protein OmpA-like peptidoglycan-associated protein
MKNFRLLPIALLVSAALAACSSVPTSDSPLAQARTEYSNAQANPQITSLAASELRQAGDSLEKANYASSKGEKKETVDHLAYVARQQVGVARETAAQRASELAVANAGSERDRIRLDARTREADSAQRSAENSQRRSDASQRSAEASQRSAEASQRTAEASQRQSEESLRQSEESKRQSQASQLTAEASQRQAAADRVAASDSQLNVQIARQQTLDAEGRARQLEALLNDLEAKKTERGMVITLGDVLFDTNQAELKPGGMRNVLKLAHFFKQYPQRTVLIEGFTDSTGSRSSNQDLSERRCRLRAHRLARHGRRKDRHDLAGIWRVVSGSRQRHRRGPPAEPACRGHRLRRRREDRATLRRHAASVASIIALTEAAR